MQCSALTSGTSRCSYTLSAVGDRARCLLYNPRGGLMCPCSRSRKMATYASNWPPHRCSVFLRSLPQRRRTPVYSDTRAGTGISGCDQLWLKCGQKYGIGRELPNLGKRRAAASRRQVLWVRVTTSVGSELSFVVRFTVV